MSSPRLTALLALAGALTLASPAAARSSPTTSIAAGTYGQAERRVLLTITTSPLSASLEVPDSLSQDPAARKTLACENPTVDKAGLVTCTIQHPNGPRSDSMSFLLTPLDADHVTLAPVGVANAPSLARIDTSAADWHAALEQTWSGQEALAAVKANLDGIRVAELSYNAAFDVYLPADPAPRPIAGLNASAVAWVGNAGFDALGWRPDGPVSASFGVTVSTGADGLPHFLVEAWADTDGDGVPAHWTGSDTEPGKQVTAAGVR